MSNKKESTRGVTPNRQLIKKLRISEGWSQEDFAEKARLALRTIQRIEAGLPVNIPTLQTIHKVLSHKAKFEELLIQDADKSTQRGEPGERTKTITAILKGDEQAANRLLAILSEHGVNIDGLRLRDVEDGLK